MSQYSGSDIESMDFSALKEAVAEMRYELTKLKKLLKSYEDNAESSVLGKRVMAESGKLRSEFKIMAGEISSKVSDENMASAISQMADKITANVSKVVDVSRAIDTEIIPTEDGEFDISEIYRYVETDDEGNKTGNVAYYYYDDIKKKWSLLTDFGIASLFEQTAEGFKLKGNVLIDGSCVMTDSLTFNTEDRPLQVEYSVNGIDGWHKEFDGENDCFMHIKIGAQWSDAMKIVGSDGTDGAPGDSATVTAQAMFDALTDDGNDQGIFAALVPGDVDGQTKVFINAEFIQGEEFKALKKITIGEVGDDTSLKMLQFNNTANISNGCDGGTGMNYNASRHEFRDGALDFSKATYIEWGKNLPTELAVFGE